MDRGDVTMRLTHVTILALIASMTSGCLSDGGALEVIEPIWANDIVPIVESSCLPCHRAGGSVGLELDTCDAFVRHGNAVLVALHDGTMPPGSVDRSGDCGEYRSYKPVTPAEIGTITRFLATAEETGEKDVEAVSALSAAKGTALALALPRYTPSTKDDDHRCFVVHRPADSGDMMTALGIERLSTSSLHHLMIFSLPTASAVGHAHALDDEDEKPGYPCEGHPRVAATELLSVWTPGQGTIAFPPNTGVAIGGPALLVQAHFHVEGQFDDDHPPPAEELAVVLYTADEVATVMRPVPIAASGFSLPPGERRVEFSLTRPSPFAGPVVVHGVFPHMHTLGASIRLEVASGQPDEAAGQCLAQSVRWRFDWQDTAFFAKPKLLAPSTPLTLRCAWDTRGRDEVTRWGEGSLDEMCSLFLFVSAADAG